MTDPKIQQATQYTVVNGTGYLPVGSTQQQLPPGVYEIREVGMSDCLVPHDLKTDSLIRIGETAAAKIISEIQAFWGLKDKFDHFGFVHKRGFLLHGPPGTGKTTTLYMVSEQIVAEGGLVIMSPLQAGRLTDILSGLRQVEPDRKVLVIFEDLDNIIRYDEVGLLSLLDGEHQTSGVVYLATTNYLARLPDRIVNRPSRFDRVVEIGPPTEAARAAYLAAKGLTPSVVAEWAVATKGLSMAHLKELVISVGIFGNDLKKETARLLGKTIVDPELDEDGNPIE